VTGRSDALESAWILFSFQIVAPACTGSVEGSAASGPNPLRNAYRLACAGVAAERSDQRERLAAGGPQSAPDP
jgi:hypothetical protein